MQLLRRSHVLAGLAAALAVAPCGDAFAATPPPGPLHLVKLPNGDYTVPLGELEKSGTSGTVTLHPSGPKTIVSVKVYGPPKHLHEFRLHSGSDCAATGAGTVTPLRPAFGGQQSQTIVSLPISDFTSKGYVVDARDATQKRQFAEACAHLH
jgi:hypothetical protein